MDKDEVQKKVYGDDDYIRCPKCSNSVNKFIAKNPEGVDNSAIGRLLMIPEEKVQEYYDEAVKMLQNDMVEDDSDHE